jgi:hypothetical protein
MSPIDDKRNELPFLGNPVDEGAGAAEMDLGQAVTGWRHRSTKRRSSWRPCTPHLA